MQASSPFGLKLKAIMLGALYYFDLRLAYAGVRKLYGHQEKSIWEAAYRASRKNWPRPHEAFTRWLVMRFAAVLAGISALDNAYAQFFRDFIDEYNKLRGEHYGIPVQSMPKEIRNAGNAGQPHSSKTSRTQHYRVGVARRE